jgi:hypothetical protein
MGGGSDVNHSVYFEMRSVIGLLIFLLNLIERLNHFRWLQPFGVIGIDKGKCYRPCSVYHKSGLYGKFKAFITTKFQDIDAQAAVKGVKLLSQGKDEAKGY